MAIRASIATGTSGADTAQDIDITVAAEEECIIYRIIITSSDGSSAFAWSLECPAATNRLIGYGPAVLDFGEEGLAVPYTTKGDDVQLTIAGAGGTVTTRGSIVYRNRKAQ